MKADVNQTEDIPTVSDEGDFEISRAVKSKSAHNPQYEVLEETQTVKGSLTPWENVFLQFRDSSGKWPALIPLALARPFHVTSYVHYRSNTDVYCPVPISLGTLLPVEVTLPSLVDEDDEEPPRRPPPEESSSTSKGKRKAPPE